MYEPRSDVKIGYFKPKEPELPFWSWRSGPQFSSVENGKWGRKNGRRTNFTYTTIFESDRSDCFSESSKTLKVTYEKACHHLSASANVPKRHASPVTSASAGATGSILVKHAPPTTTAAGTATIIQA